MHTQFHYEVLRAPRPERRHIEGRPPPHKHPPPGRRPGRVRRVLALALVRLARRIDERAAWRAFAR